MSRYISKCHDILSLNIGRDSLKQFYKSFLIKLGTVSPKDLGLVY